jgi:hypothetical protein
MDAEPDAAVGTVFRPVKRRKFTRSRRASENSDSEPQRDIAASPDNRGDAADASASGLLRLQKSKARKNGIMFSNTMARTSEPPPSTDIALIDPEAERFKAVSDRFVAHSGQVVDIDKHMFVLPSPHKTMLQSDRD